MYPFIEQVDAFSVLGIMIRVRQGSESSTLFAGIWEKFELQRDFIESSSIGKHYYGINFPTEKENFTDYLAGMRVKEDIPVAEGFVKRKVPGGYYAIFKCHVEGIGECYQKIFTEWLPASGFTFDSQNPVFEEYPEKDSSLPVRICIPLVR
jgi:predicted transcriptional regulator YdeE